MRTLLDRERAFLAIFGENESTISCGLRLQKFASGGLCTTADQRFTLERSFVIQSFAYTNYHSLLCGQEKSLISSGRKRTTVWCKYRAVQIRHSNTVARPGL